MNQLPVPNCIGRKGGRRRRYDNSGNITSITDSYQSARSQTLGYDNLNRLNSASGAYGSLSFTYDGAGNRSTRVVGGTTETFNSSSTSIRR
jgi:YD repeat-containing protein